MGWMLLVDTCGSTGAVAVAALPLTHVEAQAGQPHLLSHRHLAGRATQELLMTSVADVLRESGLRATDLEVLAVVTGPGSFTGVRIGVAAVKGLAESLEKPVVAISRLAILAAQAGSAGSVQAWIDAGRGDVFVGRYLQGRCLSEQMVRGSDAVAALLSGDTVIAMEGLPAGMAPAIQYVPEPNVLAWLPLAAEAARARAFADVALLDANYLRVPDAELHLRSLAQQQGAPVA